MGNISIGGQLSLALKLASLDVRYGPYSSIADAYDSMGPSGDDVITAGLPFGITESDDSVSVYIWTKTNDATENDCKKLDKEYVVLFSGFIDITVPVKQQSFNDIATKDDIVFLTDKKQFAYRDGLNFYINWKNRYVWSGENFIPYDNVIYIDITNSRCYYFDGVTLSALSPENGVTSINNQAPDENGNVTLTKENIEGLENVDNTADEDKEVKSANEDGAGNNIVNTYETKSDATTKNTALQTAISNLQTAVAALTGLDSTNFGGFSIQSTEADAITNIATMYTTDGFTDELRWYLAGTSLNSVKAYRYNGSDTPNLISSNEYDCLDFSGLITDVSNLADNLAELGLKCNKVEQTTPKVTGTSATAKLYVCDEGGNVLMELDGGHIKTKNFDSRDVESVVKLSSSSKFCIVDEDGNVILEVEDGHIKTKRFNSANVVRSFTSFSVLGDSWSAMKDFINPSTNSYWYPSSDPQAQGYGLNNDVDEYKEMWWYLLSTSRKMRLVQCNAWSGSRIANSSSVAESTFLARMDNLKDSDLIIILGTRNDDNNTELGTYKYADWTQEDLATYRPALAYMLDHIIKTHIGTQIVFACNSLNSDKAESAETICNHYNVPFILFSLTNAQLTGGHPNSLGMQQVANDINNLLNSL